MATSVANLAREDLVGLDPPALLGASCAACGKLSFPLERSCPHCGAAEVGRVELSPQGTIYSYAISRVPAPGYAGVVPYAVGVVELDDGIRVASTLIAEPLESLRVGAEVHFELYEVQGEDGPVIAYAYRQEAP